MAWVPGGLGCGRWPPGDALIGDMVMGTNPSIAIGNGGKIVSDCSKRL